MKLRSKFVDEKRINLKLNGEILKRLKIYFPNLEKSFLNCKKEYKNISILPNWEKFFNSIPYYGSNYLYRLSLIREPRSSPYKYFNFRL